MLTMLTRCVSVLGICLIASPAGIVSPGLIERLKNRGRETKQGNDNAP